MVKAKDKSSVPIFSRCNSESHNQGINIGAEVFGSTVVRTRMGRHFFIEKLARIMPIRDVGVIVELVS